MLVYLPHWWRLMQTTIQAETPEEMCGKSLGLQNNATNIVSLELHHFMGGNLETFLAR
jgi:hypothetical protein